MRVISMVPSLTETLIECDIQVVGRTRFCIHPKEKVKGIPVVGGTKDVRWEKAKDLHPDLVLFDKEENTLEMAESCPFPTHSTHILSLSDSAREFEKLSHLLSSPALRELAHRIETVVHSAPLSQPLFTELKGQDTVLYMIWKNPWMAVSKDTYIGSALEKLGISLPNFQSRYSTIDLSEYDPSRTFILFSSEPFPFHKQKKFVESLGYRHAFVEGEHFSWFGIRSLQHLESLIHRGD